MSSAVTKQPSKSAWTAMFQKVGHDVDRIVTSCLDEKDLNVLAVCKKWRDNAALVSLKNRCIVEWRKDQAAIAAGCDELLVRLLRRNRICFWDLPFQARHDTYILAPKIDMPRINGTSCSIAQFRLRHHSGRDGVGLVFALQSKKKGFALADPVEFADRAHRTFRLGRPENMEKSLLLSSENIEPGTNIENPPQVYLMPVIELGQERMRFTAHDAICPAYLEPAVALDAIAPLLSDTHQEIGLANRVMHVLPENSPPIPNAIPLIPRRPVRSTSFMENSFPTIMIGLSLAFLIAALWRISSRWNLSRE